jgi:hypothetical protein
MGRIMKVVGATLVCVFVMASVALAALPVAGGIYKGTSTAGDHVKLVAETRHNLSLVRVACSGEEFKWHGVHVRDDGTFKAVKRNTDFDIVTIKITGKFTSRTVAKGAITSVVCSGEDRTYTATKQ